MGAYDGPTGESKRAEEGDEVSSSEGDSDEEEEETAGAEDPNLFQMLSTAELMLCSPAPSTPSKRPPLSRNSLSLSLSIICQEINNPYESPWSVVKERSRSPVEGHLFSPPSNEKGIVSHLGGRTLMSYFNQRVETWNTSEESVSQKSEKSEKRRDDRFSAKFHDVHLENGEDVAEERFSMRFEHVNIDYGREPTEKRFSSRFQDINFESGEERVEKRFSVRFKDIDLEIDGEENEHGRGRMDDEGAVEAVMEEMICMTEMHEENITNKTDSDRDTLEGSCGDQFMLFEGLGVAGEFYDQDSPEQELSETDEASGLLQTDADELVHMVDAMEQMILDGDDDSMCLSQTDCGSEEPRQRSETFTQKEINSKDEGEDEGESEDDGSKENTVSGDAQFSFPLPRFPVPVSLSPMSPGGAYHGTECQTVSSPTALMHLLTTFSAEESDHSGAECLDSCRLDSQSKKQFVMYLRSPPNASRRESLRARIEQGEATAVELEKNLSVRLEAEERLKVINKKCESVRRKSVCFVEPGTSSGASNAQKITYGEFHTEFDVSLDEKRTPLSVLYVLNEEDTSQSSHSESPLKPARPPNCFSWIRGWLLLARRFLSSPARFR